MSKIKMEEQGLRPRLNSLNAAIQQNDSETFNGILRSFENQAQGLDQDGYSPLHVAVIHRRQEMLEQLLQHKDALGLDIDIRSNAKSESLTAWQYAERCNCKEEKVLLVQYDCDTSSAQASRDQRSHPSPSRGKYSSSKICEEAVKSIYDRVVDELNSTAIVPLLVKQGVLTLEDVQQILLQQTSRERAMLLLSLVPRKGNDDYSYRVLFSALRNDKEHRPHRNLGEDLDEICQKLMEEEQKKRYAERKKLKKGMTGTRFSGSFNNIHTIYTGSDPTPTTLGSTGPSGSPHRPDSGFRSQTRTPLEPSSGELSVEGHRQSGRRKDSFDKTSRNQQASDFNDPCIMGLQEQSRRKHYPVIDSVIKSKPHKNEEEGTNGAQVLSLHEHPQRKQYPEIDSIMVEEEGTLGGDGVIFVGGGRAMMQRRNPFIVQLSVVQEDDRQYSDTEKDGARLPPEAADHENMHYSKKSHMKELKVLTQVAGGPSSSIEPCSHKESHTHGMDSKHRSLMQVMGSPGSTIVTNEPQHTHRIDVCTRQRANSDTSTIQSSPPIRIPSRRRISTPELRSSGSSSSEPSSSGPSSTSSSPDRDLDATQGDHSSVATQPKFKVLHFPSKWERLKKYILSSLHPEESREEQSSTLGLKIL